MPISETQKGAIIENIVANLLMSNSDGRLSPFRPVADDGGIDLLVFDRQSRKTLLIQVRGRTHSDTMIEKGRKVARFSVRTATFEVRDDFYVLGVLMSSDLRTPEAFWLIPSADFEREALRAKKDEDGNPGRLVAPCCFTETSQDKWTSYRVHCQSDLVSKVFEALQNSSALAG